MKNLIFILFFLVFSCSKENYNVDFVRFGYCNVPDGVALSFVVNENKYVKDYSLEGGITPFTFNEVAKIKSNRNDGEQTYKITFKKNGLKHFRIRVNYKDRKVQFSKPFLL